MHDRRLFKRLALGAVAGFAGAFALQVLRPAGAILWLKGSC